ncbi:MAG: hypothetical protein ACRD0B_03430 [Acidimicrobiales bacterium]
MIGVREPVSAESAGAIELTSIGVAAVVVVDELLAGCPLAGSAPGAAPGLCDLAGPPPSITR